MTLRMKGRALRLVLTGVLALAALQAASNGPLARDGFKQAPPLKLPGLDGKEVAVVYSDARVTLVNFWATWCMPCREEMPAINRIYQKYHDRGLHVFGLALQSGEPSEIREFLETRKLGLTYPILLSTDEIAESYGEVDILPTTYLIGPKGEVLDTFFGLAGDFEKTIGARLEKLLVPPASPEAPSKKG
jgi:thiol-disulfide isomerase/thioredoxin